MWVKKEKGKDAKGEMTPMAPVKNPKSIVNGINGRIRILAGSATKDIFPMSYKISGKTIIYAERVPEMISRNLPNLFKK